MSSMKEIDLLADKIGDVLGINPNLISLSQVPGGLWFADVSNIESEHLDSPIKAMKNLLEKINQETYGKAV